MVSIDKGTPERHGRDGVWCDPCIEPLVRAFYDAKMAPTRRASYSHRAGRCHLCRLRIHDRRRWRRPR